MQIAVTMHHLLAHADSMVVHAHHCKLTQATQHDHDAVYADMISPAGPC